MYAVPLSLGSQEGVRRLVVAFIFVSTTGMLSCGSGGPTDAPTKPLTAAPSGLRLEIALDGTGHFSWQPLSGATSYLLLEDGEERLESSLVSAEVMLEKGASKFYVVGKNEAGRSPSSLAFPRLHELKALACASDTAEVSWRTDLPSDTAISYDDLAHICQDAEDLLTHYYGDIGTCSSDRLVSGDKGTLSGGRAIELKALSRTNDGNDVGTAWASLTLPKSYCICVGRPGEGDAECKDLGCVDGGFSLDSQTAVAADSADVHLERVEDDKSRLVAIYLVAPEGLMILEDTYLCDVTEVVDGQFTTKQLLYATDGSLPKVSGEGYGVLPSRSTTFLIRTRAGRTAKVSFEGSVVKANVQPHALQAYGARIAAILTEEGNNGFLQ